jgi:hypothetical protein
MSSRRSRSGGTFQLDHVEAVKRSSRKRPAFDFLLQVAVGGGEDAGVDADFGVGADALEAAVLRDAQQLGLELRRHLGDFIEENRAAVGHLESADALGDRAGEGAFSWPNSSLSSRFSGMAAQLTFTSGPAARGLQAWMTSARTSLPTPLSPVIRTRLSEAR